MSETTNSLSEYEFGVAPESTKQYGDHSPWATFGGGETGRAMAITHAWRNPGNRVFVPGKPAPQGSKRYLGTRGGKAIAVESSKTLPAWRADVRDAIQQLTDGQPPLTGPIAVELLFVMPRPASTPKRHTPPAVKRPDLDKLARAILDAIGSAGAWGDDSQVTDLHATKRLAGVDERPGAWITITPLDRS